LRGYGEVPVNGKSLGRECGGQVVGVFEISRLGVDGGDQGEVQSPRDPARSI
jgi:hypothetical protein